MNRKITVFLSVSLIVLCSCTNENKSSHLDEKEQHEQEQHWSYEGETSPEHWAEIEKDSDCGGMYQSPINIIEKNTVPAKESDHLEVYYSPKTLLSKVENNGHSIEFEFRSGDSIMYKDQMFYLKQIHFHEPSEHKINGLIYPIEAHLVHISSSGKITVLSLLGIEGKESQLFELFKSFLPIKNGESKEINQEIDLTKLTLQNKDYFSYSGSLTTPPCTEDVNWIIFKKPIVISLEEVLALKKNMPLNNYRIEQPINGRVVYNKSKE